MRGKLAEISGEEHLPRKISVKILSEEAPPPPQKILVNVIEGKVNWWPKIPKSKPPRPSAPS
jgi:hypothetical protein